MMGDEFCWRQSGRCSPNCVAYSEGLLDFKVGDIKLKTHCIALARGLK
jgi:hypothetical protein